MIIVTDFERKIQRKFLCVSRHSTTVNGQPMRPSKGFSAGPRAGISNGSSFDTSKYYEKKV